MHSEVKFASAIEYCKKATAKIPQLDITICIGKVVYLQKAKGSIIGIKYLLQDGEKPFDYVDGNRLLERRKDLRTQRNEMMELLAL